PSVPPPVAGADSPAPWSAAAISTSAGSNRIPGGGPIMRKLFPLLFAATVLADAPPPSTEDALVAHLTAAKFTESKTPNSPKGSQGAVIGVDANTNGATNTARTPAATGL